MTNRYDALNGLGKRIKTRAFEVEGDYGAWRRVHYAAYAGPFVPDTWDADIGLFGLSRVLEAREWTP